MMANLGDLVQIGEGREILSSFAVLVEIEESRFSVVKIRYGLQKYDPTQHIDKVGSIRRPDRSILSKRHYVMANRIRRRFGFPEVKQNKIIAFLRTSISILTFFGRLQKKIQ